MGGPHGTYMALAIGSNEAVAVWIGGALALRTRAYKSAWATTPHDLKQQFLADGHDFPADTLPDVIVRALADGSDAAPAFATTPILVGDVLVIANNYVHRRLGADAIAFIASVSI